jgi:hypothetical protein
MGRQAGGPAVSPSHIAQKQRDVSIRNHHLADTAHFDPALVDIKLGPHKTVRQATGAPLTLPVATSNAANGCATVAQSTRRG